MRMSPERLMLTGVGVLVLALIVRRFFVPMALSAVALFGLGYAWYLVARKRVAHPPAASPPVWRGQPVRREGNVIEFRDSWPNRIRRWLRGR